MKIKRQIIKRILIFIFIAIAGLILLNVGYWYWKPPQFVIVLDKDYQGKINIFFNKGKNLNLSKVRGHYLAFIPKNGILETSYSMKNENTVSFLHLRYDYGSKKFVIGTAKKINLMRLSDWYSGDSTSYLSGNYKNKEVYVGYCYSDTVSSSKDSLFKFLNSINGDTLLFTESFTKRIPH